MNNNLKSPQALFDISGKVAIVTGALGAFGQVATRTLAAAGCKLVIADNRAEELDALASGLQQSGAEIETIALWPSSEKNCDAMIQKAVQHFGQLDILVMASGMMHVNPVQDLSLIHI